MKNKTAELKLPSGFYNHGTPCKGCRGCNADDFVFDNYKDVNSNVNDNNPLPLTHSIKQFSKSITTKPSLTTFGQLSKTTEASRNIFGTVNSSTSDQGLFTQLSFTPNKEAPSTFGNNIFGGNKSIFSKTNDEQKVSSTPDDVKKNFSFTNSLKPSVFGQNIFGQATTPLTSLNPSFGNNEMKTSEDTGAQKPFSFGERLAATTPTTKIFGSSELCLYS